MVVSKSGTASLSMFTWVKCDRANYLSYSIFLSQFKQLNTSTWDRKQLFWYCRCSYSHNLLKFKTMCGIWSTQINSPEILPYFFFAVVSLCSSLFVSPLLPLVPEPWCAPQMISTCLLFHNLNIKWYQNH